MNVVICKDKAELGTKAAAQGADLIRQTIAASGRANIILATGASQFQMLAALIKAEGIDWSKVTAFHLDEYVGLAESHPASFRKYLKERLAEKLPMPIGEFHYVDGQADPQTECHRLGELIRRHPIDVAFVGIGENGHLAFNDPPADFQTDEPYIVAELDEACRRQQLGEGWFKKLNEVPTRAISMSIRQIMASEAIICSVPDERKADAVRMTLEGEITPQAPASVLRRHGNCHLYLDEASASLLTRSK